ncbi:MAG: endonuclease MutS2 [Candidatus Marinimicrobia bacterium]|nr:endonuclease MutS2 [Candidatus Neomarinimicrobiota bacterium]
MDRLFQQLGFDLVREKIASYALTENARLSAKNCPSFLPHKQYPNEQEKLLEMRDLLLLDTAPPLSAFPSQEAVIKKARVRGSLLTEEELLTLAGILQSARQSAAYFRQRLDKCPRLARIAEQYDPGLEKLERELLAVFDPEGHIADNASPLLHKLRREIAGIEAQIRSKVNSIAAEWLAGGIAAEDAVAFRNGRQVIPIRASRKSRAPGIIHDQSQTGQTLYVEPVLIVEMNNALYQARQEERNELRRILLALSTRVRELLSPLAAAISLLEDLDLIRAKARLAVDFHCEKPGKDEDSLRIRNGRNLELCFSKREPVPLNLKLDKSKRGIIITGPNAGGKTVTLKTIGLLALMNQAGLLIPADADSALPEYDRIFVDIGDGQSIDGGLSTFSSHILSLKNILDNAGSRSLVLIDELGTGTDPDEGAALAEGMLKVLSERGSTVIATTHHGALKTLAFENPLFENGSMSFNDRNLEPGYVFIPDIPGSSYAIEIARRYELDEEVIRLARERVGKQREKLERLILDLQRKISRYDLQLKHAKEKERQYTEKLTELNEKKGDIDQKYKRAEKDALKRAESMVADLRKELEASIREIRERQAGKEAIRNAQAVFHEVQENIREKSHALPEQQAAKLRMKDLKPGLRVFIRSMQQNGTVLEVNEKTGKIWVDVDGSRLRLKADWLEPEQRREQRISTSVQNHNEGSVFRLDLRGKRAEEALSETDKFLDNAVISGLQMLEILHGTGQGILQKVIHDLLSKDPRVVDYQFAPPEQGGVGVTYVKMR